MNNYLFSVAAVCLLGALLAALIPEGGARRTVRFGCGILTALVALSPLVELDYDDIAKQLAQLRLDTEAARTGVEVQNRELQARIISEQAAAYIWDKADALGLTLEIEVQTTDRGSGPYPYSASLRGTCGDADRAVLSRYIEQTLAIPTERQVWECE